MPSTTAAGHDPLDAQIAAITAAPPRPGSWRGRRLALGFSPTPLPLAAIALAGITLGPHGIAIFGPRTLDALAPIVAVALCAVGCIVGASVDFRSRREPQLIVLSGIESATTLVLTALWFAAAGVFLPAVDARIRLALLVGACAAASASTPAAYTQSQLKKTITRLTDLDDLLPILAAALIVAVPNANPLHGLIFAGAAALLACALAFAGHLLIASTNDEGEQRVFIVSVLLLLAGMSQLLAFSPLCAGLAAGMFWSAFYADDVIVRNVRLLQHPVAVLLVASAGARIEWSWMVVLLAAMFAVARAIGKIGGGLLAGVSSSGAVPPRSGIRLLPAGLMTCAIALAAWPSLDAASAAIVLSTVTAGAIISDLVSFAVHTQEEA
jgi:hypothetical protein